MNVIGHNQAISDFLSAMRSGRLHHAWLLEGPEGIGKSQVAKCLSACLFGVDIDLEPNSASCPDSHVAQALEQRSHPDFRYIERGYTDAGKLQQDIPTDAIRELSNFFSLKPAMGGRRVAVVDSLDEMNLNGTNALLKTLEEPPKNSVLFLIQHGKKPLLPTIRSRCRRMKLDRLPQSLVDGFIDLPDNQKSEHEVICRTANGSLGIAAKWIQSLDPEFIATLEKLFETEWPKPKAETLNTVLKQSASKPEQFEFFVRYVDIWLSSRSKSDQVIHALSAQSKSWQKIQELCNRGRRLNLDRYEIASACVNELQHLGRELGR